METRKWEEELAGRWFEISALVAGGSGAQAREESNPLSAINQRERRAEKKKVKTKN